MPKNQRIAKDASIFLRLDEKDLAKLQKVAERNNFDKVTDYLRWHIKKVTASA